MSQWTHPICDDCWDIRRPESKSPRVGEGDIEHCCWCGRHTTSGIYVRDDPANAPRHAEHPE